MMETKTYPPKITAALHAVMEKCGYVQKKKENAFHRYKYAGEGDLLEALRPAMVEAGLLLIPSCAHQTKIDEFGNVNVTMEYTLAHKDGDVWPEKIVAFGTGNDKNKQGGVGDKGTYKAITGANKYLLFKLFQIETGDDPEEASEADKSGGKVAPQTKPQAAPKAANTPAPVTTEASPEAAEQFVNTLRVKLSKCREITDVDHLVKVNAGAIAKLAATFPDLWKQAEDAVNDVRLEILNDPARLRRAG